MAENDKDHAATLAAVHNIMPLTTPPNVGIASKEWPTQCSSLV
jgi:hypothetical protein